MLKLNIHNKINSLKKIYNSYINFYESNVFQRTVLGAIMLYMFYLLCQGKKIYIIIFNIFLTLGICYELIFLAKKPNKPFPIHPFKIFIILFLIYFSQIISIFPRIYPILHNSSLIRKSEGLLFILYAFTLISAVISFKKSILSSQLLIFTMSHIIGYILGLSCKLACGIIEKGCFFYFYPCILIISNDIFAYIIGKTFGKTPLYALSPKKTIEGFLGASFFTYVVGIFLCYLKEYRGFLPDKNPKSFIQFKIGKTIYNTPALFLHNIVFASFASFVAPFVGFLASAIKRSFNKKDFGKLIPGHGGITDRMDCQLLMVFFTYLYLKLVLLSKYESILNLVNYISYNYNNEEIKELINNLSKFVNR